MTFLSTVSVRFYDGATYAGSRRAYKGGHLLDSDDEETHRLLLEDHGRQQATQLSKAIAARRRPDYNLPSVGWLQPGGGECASTAGSFGRSYRNCARAISVLVTRHVFLQLPISSAFEPIVWIWRYLSGSLDQGMDLAASAELASLTPHWQSSGQTGRAKSCIASLASIWTATDMD